MVRSRSFHDVILHPSISCITQRRVPQPCRDAPHLPACRGRGRRRSRRPRAGPARSTPAVGRRPGVQRKVARLSTSVRSAPAGGQVRGKLWLRLRQRRRLGGSTPRSTQAAAPLTTKANRPGAAAERRDRTTNCAGRAVIGMRERSSARAGARRRFRVDRHDRLVAQRRGACRPAGAMRRDQARRFDRSCVATMTASKRLAVDPPRTVARLSICSTRARAHWRPAATSHRCAGAAAARSGRSAAAAGQPIPAPASSASCRTRRKTLALASARRVQRGDAERLDQVAPHRLRQAGGSSRRRGADRTKAARSQPAAVAAARGDRAAASPCAEDARANAGRRGPSRSTQPVPRASTRQRQAQQHRPGRHRRARISAASAGRRRCRMCWPLSSAETVGIDASRAAAELRRHLEQRDRVPEPRHLDGGGQPGPAAADHGDALARIVTA